MESLSSVPSAVDRSRNLNLHRGYIVGIRGSLSEFKRNHKQRFKWPSLKMTSTGPKLNLYDLCCLPFDIAEEHAAFLLRYNGAEPENTWYMRKGEVSR